VAEVVRRPTPAQGDKPAKGKVFKHVIEPKKTVKAFDGAGDWDVIAVRAKTKIEKNINSSDDETDEDF